MKFPTKRRKLTALMSRNRLASLLMSPKSESVSWPKDKQVLYLQQRAQSAGMHVIVGCSHRTMQRMTT